MSIHLRAFTTFLVLTCLVGPVNAQPASTLVSYSVVCDDPSLKIVFEQKVVALIQATKGFAVDTTGKADLRILFAVAPVKRRKDKEEELLSLAVATLGLNRDRITHFENRIFPPQGYEDGLSKLIPDILGRK